MNTTEELTRVLKLMLDLLESHGLSEEDATCCCINALVVAANSSCFTRESVIQEFNAHWDTYLAELARRYSTAS